MKMVTPLMKSLEFSPQLQKLMFMKLGLMMGAQQRLMPVSNDPSF